MRVARISADVIAILEGLMWLLLAWSVTFSIAQGTTLPTMGALSLIGTVIIVTWGHRPMRLTLARYRIRKRRTEMWMHVLALPLLLALCLAIPIEALLSPLSGPQKMLLFNILASAGWVMFAFTVIAKQAMFSVKRSKKKKRLNQS
ncbi:hypothetical protein L861_02345 [Litchfieldella anticariensis FP35 = DSM 16096]|uniref:Transmembrane protein n=1 Tax=Litchfieldella anticariensis (strain DSM 16096 / CECT 5854 / CIP 108499 / LMG 22089 / FP35) TaxID=1121939 RepID=S2KQ04_LITA3|nr:hypothetical protein [Halomonas anticariensis]EPC04172.1 hypothetical protein L861_02345 [Halomonas anticariensis FP35 = DSM 16096]